MKLMITLTMVLMSDLAVAHDRRESVADDLMSAGHARIYEEHRQEIEGDPAHLDAKLWEWAASSTQAPLRRTALRQLPDSPNALSRLDDLFVIVDDAAANHDEETALLALKAVSRIMSANSHEHHRLLMHYNGVKHPEVKSLYLDRAEDLNLIAPATFPRELSDLLDADPLLQRKAFQLGLRANDFEGPNVSRLTHRMAKYLSEIDDEGQLQDRLNLIARRVYEGRALDPLIPVLRKLRGHHESEQIRSTAEYALFLLRGAGVKASLVAGQEALGDLCRSLLVRASFP